MGRLRSLIILRHAHRDTSHRELDNGLSPKGLSQVEGLLKDPNLLKVQKPVLVMSSPKKRCVQTIEPLARQWGSQLEIEPLLDEQAEAEDSRAFRGRIEKFMNGLDQLDCPTLAICGHGDWIPEAVSILHPAHMPPAFHADISKGTYLLFQRVDDRWQLRN